MSVINQVINQLEEELLSSVNEEEEGELFNLSKDFMRFKFRTDDNLAHKKINIPVFVI